MSEVDERTSNAGRGAHRPRVVIVGGGFAGLYAARSLRRAPVRVTLIDRRNHHLFQPLLYEVATAALSAAEIAEPIRRIFRKARNVEVLLGDVADIDTDDRRVILADSSIDYDYLMLATGATHSYFGNDAWAPIAPGLKTADDALEIRRRYLLAFEAAEREADPEARQSKLTFVVVGAGPTGVEMAGTMMEVARRSVPSDFRSVDTTTARVILVEGKDRVLPTFEPALSASAERHLEQLGVEVRLNSFVTGIDEDGVLIGDERIRASNVIWAAGVAASPLGAKLGAECDNAGRVRVEPDLSIPGHPEVFVVGDLAAVSDPDTGDPVPGVAPAAIQMGRYVANLIKDEQRDPRAKRKPFRYRDKGMLATIGRAKAVGYVGPFKVSGLIAWLAWALVHIFYLIGFRNRVIVMLRWMWAYVIFTRGARLIFGESKLNLRQPGRSVFDETEREPASQKPAAVGK